jgi:hypothetical protein
MAMVSEHPNYRRSKEAALDLLDEMGIVDPPVDPVQIARHMGVNVNFVTFDASKDGVSGFYDCEETQFS